MKYQAAEPSPEPVQPPEDEIDPEVSKTIDQRVQQILKEGGYVPKTELDRENLYTDMKTIDENFYKSYPEYVYSQELRTELDGIIDTMKEPKTAGEYKKQLDMAHNLVKQSHPDKFPVSAAGSSAQKRLDIASRGTGGESKPSTSTSSSLSQEQVAELRRGGWTEEEIKEYNKEYRNRNK